MLPLFSSFQKLLLGEKEMAKVLTYYEKNVPYYITVRMNIRDNIGKLLTTEDPFIAVDIEELRDFKVANKKAIIDGLIKPAEEPTIDWDTPNTITDDEITSLLKSFLQLKQKMHTVTSVPIAHKFLRAAKEQNKSPKVIGLIQERLDELQGIIESPDEMRGVE